MRRHAFSRSEQSEPGDPSGEGVIYDTAEDLFIAGFGITIICLCPLPANM